MSTEFASGETLAVDFVGRVVAFPFPEEETNRNFADRQLVAENVQKEAAVTRRERVRHIAEQHDRRRRDRDLRRVINFRLPIVEERRRRVVHRGDDQLVQAVRRNTHSTLTLQHLRVLQKFANVFAGHTGNEGDRDVPHRRERLAKVLAPTLGRHMFLHFVPFIDDENTRFVVFFD